MRRATSDQVSPWIEKLILSYGSEEGSSAPVRLNAHVIGVGELTDSQTRTHDGPKGLLFVSDGVVNMPVLLTSTAWEEIQDNWDKECFSSMIDSSVCMKKIQLRFHMSMEDINCRFFLVVDKMFILSVGTEKEKTPCCTSLPSVHKKIYETWSSLMVKDGQEYQNSQFGFDLSELLGEMQFDCFRTVMLDVHKRLMQANGDSQEIAPGIPLLNESDLFTATSWDTERIQDKGMKCFSIPMKCLLIPEGDAPLEKRANVARPTPDRELDLQLCDPSQSFVDAADGKTDTHARDERENLAENMHADHIRVDTTENTIIPPADPWHNFPAPCSSSNSFTESPEETNIQFIPPQQQKCALNITSTPVPINAQPDVNTSQHSKGEHSFLPPYQKLPPSLGNSNNTQTQHIHTASQEKQTLIENSDVAGRQCGKSKRKRELEFFQKTQNKITLEEEEEAHQSGSPPSWLFDSMANDGSIQVQTMLAEKRRRTPAVHSDGRPFSYTYKVTAKNLLDLSQFKVEDSLLHWAVKYLVDPKQATHQ
uniref:adrenocortical dysplasia protein homolog n=1 Tax=Doryrhamphus excisus TaxID=161450 RepID=UPI0025AE72B7|nr:adrenocortical dysplasia protein homolog [Doryrhamphus excisus]XP_057931571.1 adrenocortical dysplasia protein homolog [Doryrhamphus excisus]